MNKFLFILVINALFLACSSKNEVSPEKTEKNVDIFRTFLRNPLIQEADAYLGIYGYQVSSTTQGLLPVVKTFVNFNTQPEGGNVSIGNINMTPNPRFGYNVEGRDVAYQENFGKYVSFKVEGNAEIDGLLDSMYVPKAVTMNITKKQSNTISLKGGQNITWNSDLNNKNYVAVVFIYDKTMINRDEPNYEQLPDKLIANYKLFDESTNNYTIQESDLEGMPKDALIQVMVVRGNEKYARSINGKKKYNLYTYFHDSVYLKTSE